MNAEFNYERQPQMIVTVKAEDTNVPPHTAYAQITVNVQDLNDEKPELYMVTLPVSNTATLTNTNLFTLHTARLQKPSIERSTAYNFYGND